MTYIPPAIKYTAPPWSPDGGNRTGRIEWVRANGIDTCFVGKFTQSGLCKTIARVNGQLPEREANTRLITASPLLLQHLEITVATLENVMLQFQQAMTPADCRSRNITIHEAQVLMAGITGGDVWPRAASASG